MQKEIGMRQRTLHKMDLGIKGVQPHGVVEMFNGTLVLTKQHAYPTTLSPSVGQIGVHGHCPIRNHISGTDVVPSPGRLRQRYAILRFSEGVTAKMTPMATRTTDAEMRATVELVRSASKPNPGGPTT